MKNRKLKSLMKLSCHVALFVPSTVDVDRETDNTEQVDSALRMFSKVFGGATAADALGCWLSGAGSLVKERVTVVFSYCSTAQLDAGIDAVVQHAEALRSAMQQEAIALEINGELYFV